MWKQNLASILEDMEHRSRFGKWLDAFLVSLILLNVLAIVLESVPHLARSYHETFKQFELFSVMIFTVEYFTRIYCCVYTRASTGKGKPHWKIRLKYIFSPLALFDLIAILPFYLALFFNLDLRFLRAFRILRIFKLSRYSKAMQLLLMVLKEEKKSLAAAFSILFVVLILASCGIYLIENEVQPDKFGTIPDAMWWAMATLTTVGYGDVTPITAWGKLFGGIITIVSMGMVALPAGILASGFIDQMERRRQRFNIMLQQVLQDGHIDEREAQLLEFLRVKLGIHKDEAEILLELAKKNRPKHPSFCPHCGGDLHEFKG
mgnify:CR=1 FL=1